MGENEKEVAEGMLLVPNMRLLAMPNIFLPDNGVCSGATTTFQGKYS